jgi:hypothetical protein
MGLMGSSTAPAALVWNTEIADRDTPPENTDEIEVKFDVGSQTDLNRILGALVARGLFSRTYYENNPEPFYRRRKTTPGILYTHPVSCYLDNDARALYNSGATFRLRLTPNQPDYIQWSVKGKGRGFDGPGGAIRHEDEVVTDSLIVQSNPFTNATTLELLAPLQGQTLAFYFATDVRRQMVGVPVVVGDKRAIFEVSADPIYFRRLVQDGPLDLTRSFNRHAIETYHTLHQIEVEYVHPKSADPHMARLAEAMGLSQMNKAEIEEAMHIVRATIMRVAADLGIALDPNEKSKAGTGFETLPEGARPVRIEPAILSL